MGVLIERDDVVKLISNYYYAPESSRETLLDNIILAIKCMPPRTKNNTHNRRN
jgi:hypothetical protein